MQPSNGSVGEECREGGTFPKAARLRKRAEFIRLSASDKKCSARGFLLIWQANTLNTPRLGITVSRKVGCAVVRNRVKRYVREIFRRQRDRLPAVDVNVIARRESALMGITDVQRELEKAFRHIGASTCSLGSCSPQSGSTRS